MDLGCLIAELARRITILEDELYLAESRGQRIDDDKRNELTELRGNVLATTVNGRPVIAIDGGKATWLTLLDEQGHITVAIRSGGQCPSNSFQVRDYTGRIIARLQTFDERGGGGVMFSLGGNRDHPCGFLSVLVKDESIIVTDRSGEVVFRVPSA